MEKYQHEILKISENIFDFLLFVTKDRDLESYGNFSKLMEQEDLSITELMVMATKCFHVSKGLCRNVWDHEG